MRRKTYDFINVTRTAHRLHILSTSRPLCELLGMGVTGGVVTCFLTFTYWLLLHSSCCALMIEAKDWRLEAMHSGAMRYSGRLYNRLSLSTGKAVSAV